MKKPSILFLLLTATTLAQVTTSQYGNQRTGATLTETTLTPANVNVASFGKIGAFHVDGPVYAQPLFVSAVEIPDKGKRDVLFVATEHDSVYAFDAVRPKDPPLWHAQFLDSKNGTTAVPVFDVHCPFIAPEIGITATPVIDSATGTLFVLARTKKGGQYLQHLHALSIATGAEKFGGPQLITAFAPGNAKDSVNGRVTFDPLRENPRAALLLVNRQVVLTWASSCDVEPYHGWVMTYDADTLRQTGALNLTPNGRQGGIWASDTGPAADGTGNVFIATGNGTFDESGTRKNYGNSVLKLTVGSAGLAIRDFFTPHDHAYLDDKDWDLGSSGPLLLPDQTGAHPHLLLQPSKGGKLYLLDRDRLGAFQIDKDAALQEIQIPGNGFYGAIAYWHGRLFLAASDDSLREYRLTDGVLQPVATSQSVRFGNPGATPSISSNQGRNAIVWAIATRPWNGAERPALLYAFDANDISKPIYTSEQNVARDLPGLATRFAIPVVAKGRVYFGTREAVEVYGLLK